MKKYSFSPQERYAIYTVHGEKCYLCKKPIDLQSMHVDHIIPEDINNNKNKLNEIKSNFGLDENFDLNTFPNWLPSCSRCNIDKSNTVFDPVPAILIQLNKAKLKAEKAKKCSLEVTSKQKISRALNIIMSASTNDQLNERNLEILLPLVSYHNNIRNNDKKSTIFHMTSSFDWDESKEEIIKKRDIITISKVINYIDVTRFHYVLERYSFRTVHASDMMYMAYLGEVFHEMYTQSSPHIYDKKLRKKINQFLITFYSCSNSVGNNFSDSEHTKIFSFMPVSSYMSYEHWQRSHSDFQDKVRNQRQSFTKLIKYIKKKYFEVDFDETTEIAKKKYKSFLG